MVSLLAAVATLWYLSISEEGSFSSFTDVFLAPLFAVVSYGKSFFETAQRSFIGKMYAEIVAQFADRTQHSRGLSTLLGMIITVPVVILLILSFASADPIYYSFLKRIIYPELLQEIPWRIVFSFILMIACVPLVSPKARRVYLSPGSVLSRIQLTRELTMVMAASALVILSFIVVQWPYVFVNVKAETDLSQYGIATYAEYVKKGFIELLRVSGFIYLLLWTGLTVLRQSHTRSRMLTALQWIIMGEFAVILISIARRVYLYQLYHGLTLVRVYGTLCLVFLSLLTLTLAGRHLSRRIRFGRIEGGIVIMFFLVVGFWNVELYIVHTHPPTVNNRVDNVYLSRLSADGVDGWVQSYDHAKQVIGKYMGAQGTLDTHARQEIAYAYYVLLQMTNQYQEYALRYDSRTEFQHYVRTIVDFQISRLVDEEDRLIAQQDPKDIGYIKDRTGQIQKTIAIIKKLPDEMSLESVISDEKRTPTERVNMLIENVDWTPLPTFEFNPTPSLLSFYSSFLFQDSPDGTAWYQQTIVDRYKAIKPLDRVYLFNTSDIHAYSVMKKQMPLSELLTLQKDYYVLWERISKQSERDYERDISLESPLLR
jgi:hypothetical protein